MSNDQNPTTENPPRVEPWCRECGMPLKRWSEPHPIGACDLYRKRADPAAVRAIYAPEKTA